MDVLALAKINELKRQGGVGYDTRKTAPLSIEWDGEIGGREVFGEGNEMMVKVSSSTPSFEELQAGDFLASGTDEYQKLITEDTEYYEEEGLAAIASGFIYVVYDDNNYFRLSKGVWFGKFIIGDGSIYISRMRVPSVTTGELKTIDPKFLPNGGGLPLLELSQKTIVTTAQTGQGKLTAEETVILEKAWKEATPLIIKGSFNGLWFSGVSNLIVTENNINCFEANTGIGKFRLTFLEDSSAKVGWIVMITE